MTLNMLRQAAPNPAISAWDFFSVKKFNYSAMPLRITSNCFFYLLNAAVLIVPFLFAHTNQLGKSLFVII